MLYKLRVSGALWYQTWHFWLWAGWLPPFDQGAKRNGDFRCYQQATHPVPPAGLCRMDRKSYCCSFQVIFLRFSQFPCNLPGTPCVDQEGINEQSQPFWGPLRVVFSSRGYTGPDWHGWELVRRTSSEHILFLWPVKGWVRCGKTILVGSLILLVSFCVVVLLCAGSADYGRLGNQTPDFSYCFKFIWSL